MTPSPAAKKAFHLTGLVSIGLAVAVPLILRTNIALYIGLFLLVEGAAFLVIAARMGEPPS
ncbi:MAG TPA: hypothetical protein VNC78_06925 [Actinomycetota bacterium]|nr:hypothetical protein [Actinomycetota bacterium]